ncbi:NAD(P)H-dependent glycerol-3-phosphate dehydrogenase [Prosthecomicrobium hirschii]|uniref:NAD(P)H-dependent glycerol-3-phosphate dehydrogenase n=1 Tax=Prosthecodimorpha hirschii TaxID=665126 RepID=UPI002220E310|nr:NAD(P)H-dependent glycerol-3-phosphate dehydrogenase [Prosthecomicrobium hirschii]MCW1842780.1 NAD(P)-dependent glycerol-3-phosphate dehydrogenase [Prosthecomicrobium hirschii]
MSGIRVGVFGGGAWGTALALVAARAGRTVTLWARDRAVAAEVGSLGTNSKFLPGIRLEPRFTATGDLAEAAAADIVIAAVPAQATRGLLRDLAAHVRPGVPVLVAAKGIERGTDALMTEIVAAELPGRPAAVLSGPSFADDVARGLPTALTVAAADGALAERLSAALVSPSFRPYAATDVVGVQIGGALKNVIAIASGIVVGRGLGASAQAALTARGFAELGRLARALGAEPETLMGLSGLGDLVLSATSRQSRNFSLGIGIGEGRSVADLTGTGAKLAEGAFTASVALDLAECHGVDLPITGAVAAVLAGRLSVDAAVEGLMTRPLRREGT